jgi:hypothetical protein
MDLPDDLDEYLRGDSALSRQYGRESSPVPPHALDRRVLRMSREAQGKSPCLAPLAFAASVLLSVALVLAIVFGPQTTKRVDDAPHLVRIAARAEVPADAPLQRKLRLYGNDPQHLRAPSVWLADIAALRRAGRNGEADAEYRRFRSAYPGYIEAAGADRPSGALVIRP